MQIVEEALQTAASLHIQPGGSGPQTGGAQSKSMVSSQPMMTVLSVASTQQESSDVELGSSNNKAEAPKHTNSATQVMLEMSSQGNY